MVREPNPQSTGLHRPPEAGFTQSWRLCHMSVHRRKDSTPGMHSSSVHIGLVKLFQGLWGEFCCPQLSQTLCGQICRWLLDAFLQCVAPPSHWLSPVITEQ